MLADLNISISNNIYSLAYEMILTKSGSCPVTYNIYNELNNTSWIKHVLQRGKITDILVCPRRLPSGAWMWGACFFIGRLRSLVVRALERYSKDPGSSPGGDACFSH